MQGESALSDSRPVDDAKGASPPWLLFLGAATGLALAAFGLLEDRADSRALRADAAARVGERTIRRIDYERVLAGVEGDLRNPIDDATRRRVLERMIDEELLVQRALELGLAMVDRRIRGELTSGLIDSIVSEADLDRPSDDDVARHFEENVSFFSRPGRLHARTIYFSKRNDGSGGRDAAERSMEAIDRLRRGEDPSEVERLLGELQVSPLPDGMLPPSKIRDYVGPIILEVLEGLAADTWSDPIESGGGIYLARVIDRDPRIVPDLDEVEGMVRQDLKRRRGDEALRRYLDELRAQKTVVIAESLFKNSS